MTERPILFSGPMVRALLDGRKTQTRRIVKPQFAADAEPEEMSKVSDEGFQMSGHSGRWWDAVTGSAEDAIRCPYGVPGDLLWVKERGWMSPSKLAFLPFVENVPPQGDVFRDPSGRPYRAWPSIHMPRWASRLTLTITDVRVERLQDISEPDAEAEGVQIPALVPILGAFWSSRDGYARLWEHINGKGSWAANPWVWAVTFEVQARP